MEIHLKIFSQESESNTSTSPWNSLLANWSADLSTLLDDPSLQENLLGQIEALTPIAAKCGSATFANLFLVFINQYKAFLANPSKLTLATITTEINTKLIPAAPQSPLSCNTVLADQTCELLLYKINPYNPDINQDEIAGILAAIQMFAPQNCQSQVQQIETDYSNYIKFKDETYLMWTQTAINSLIAMLQN